MASDGTDLQPVADAPGSIRHTERVLHELVGDAGVKTAVTAEPAVQILGTPTGDEPTVSDTEADEMEERLRGLGYIE